MLWFLEGDATVTTLAVVSLNESELELGLLQISWLFDECWLCWGLWFGVLSTCWTGLELDCWTFGVFKIEIGCLEGFNSSIYEIWGDLYGDNWLYDNAEKLWWLWEDLRLIWGEYGDELILCGLPSIEFWLWYWLYKTFGLHCGLWENLVWWSGLYGDLTLQGGLWGSFKIESELNADFNLAWGIGETGDSHSAVSKIASVLEVDLRTGSATGLNLHVRFRVETVKDLRALQRLDVDFDLDGVDNDKVWNLGGDLIGEDVFGGRHEVDETDVGEFWRTLKRVLGTGLGGNPWCFGDEVEDGGRERNLWYKLCWGEHLIGVALGDDVIDEAEETPDDDDKDIADDPQESELAEEIDDLSEIEDLADETLPPDSKLALVVLWSSNSDSVSVLDWSKLRRHVTYGKQKIKSLEIKYTKISY